MTKDAIIASNMARRNFDETTSIVIDELKTQEAKRYYCKMILMCITAKTVSYTHLTLPTTPYV